MSAQQQDKDPNVILDTARSLLTHDVHQRVCTVRRLCQQLQSFSLYPPEKQQLPPQRDNLETESKRRLLQLLHLVATDDVDPRVRMAAIGVPCVARESLFHALKDRDFGVRFQAVKTVVQTWTLNCMPMIDVVRVLATIAMEPNAENTVKLIALVQKMLSEHTQEPISISWEQTESSHNTIDDQFSSDAILAQVTLLSEHENDKVRAATANAVSSVAQLNLVGIDTHTLTTNVMQVLRNLSQDTSLRVVRAASYTLLSILQLSNCSGHYAQLQYIHQDQMLALLSLHGGKAQSSISNETDAQLVIQLLNCSRCQSFRAYCLATAFLRRRLFCAQVETNTPLTDLKHLWAECLHTLAKHHPHFETILQLGRQSCLVPSFATCKPP